MTESRANQKRARRKEAARRARADLLRLNAADELESLDKDGSLKALVSRLVKQQLVA